MTRLLELEAERGHLRITGAANDAADKVAPFVARVVNGAPGTLSVALIPTQAILLDGDWIEVAVRVGARTKLEIVEVAGVVAYPGDGLGAAYTTRISVGNAGALVWKAMPLVVADGARLERLTTVTLGKGATACLRETLVLGRSGEQGGWLRATTRVDDPAGPVLREQLLADGRHRLPGIMGAAKVLDQAMLVGADPAETDPAWLKLARPGVVARALTDAAHRAKLDPVFDAWAA
ncbi:MAG: urease accessory protein UreD [Propionibacteriaceae bacterium]|jgi:urease accessory protein|nr:urease accessory protein UreD [Propionibacteriaceae bacterium]